MKPERPFPLITTVYSYRSPAVRRAIDRALRQGFPHGVIMGSTNPTGGLDAFHRPLIEQVVSYYAEDVPALGGFEHSYPTPGSEEGIREVMTLLQSQGVTQIYVLAGEYEGYKEVGKTRCIKTIEVSSDTNPAALQPGYFFISNPSARDGNIIPDEFIKAICDAGHRVFYDLAYLGTTPRHTFDVSHPNIFAVVVSMSKPYGLFYDRIGFAFSREPIPALYGNKWFKSIFALMIAQAVLAEIKPGQLHATYGPIQRAIIDSLNDEFGLVMKPSDAFLLALLDDEAAQRLSPEQRNMIAKFRRGDGYRFCLTPEYYRRDPDRALLFFEWYINVSAHLNTLSDQQRIELEALREEFIPGDIRAWARKAAWNDLQRNLGVAWHSFTQLVRETV